jgi:ElaB/YqjD/DUF883 family membrane-anchored ribosome-binding protein
MTKSIVKRISAEADDIYTDTIKGLRKMAHHLGEDVGDAASEAALSLVRNALDLAEQVRDQSKTLARKAKAEIKEHPATAAAIAAAAVALIGLVAARRARNAA